MRTALAMAAALLLAACGSTPKENYYTLSAEAGGPPAAVAGSVSVHVAAPVAVPEAVDRSPMVIRTGSSQVDIDDLHRWVEPLKHAIPRALAELLMRELGTPHVVAGRLTSATPADYRVVLDVQRFDSSFAEGATLDVAWIVTPAKGPPRNGRTFAREAAPSRDHAGIAAAHRRALEKLAREIAASIKN